MGIFTEHIQDDEWSPSNEALLEHFERQISGNLSSISRLKNSTPPSVNYGPQMTENLVNIYADTTASEIAEIINLPGFKRLDTEGIDYPCVVAVFDALENQEQLNRRITYEEGKVKDFHEKTQYQILCCEQSINQSTKQLENLQSKIEKESNNVR